MKQFVLGLIVEPSGLVLELNGQPVAWMLPPPKSANGPTEVPKWTDAKNARRVALIQQKHEKGLLPAEQVELAGLQEEMLRFRQKVAPLPLDDARRLHQELLARTASQNTPK